MNYISEINNFYDWLETNHLSKSAISLWNALMHINNKANWVESFAVAISTLEFKTGFKRSELFEARNILAQKGRIVWETRGGNLSAVYSIVPFCVRNADASTYTNGNTKLTQKYTINKLNKEEKKDLESSNEDSLSGGEPPDVTETIDYKKFVDWFNAETQGVFGIAKYPLGDKRKASIRARVREHGKKSFFETIKRAKESDFLKGQNQRGFTATLDWLIKPANFEKVLSGNYDNKNKKTGNEEEVGYV